VNEWDRAVEVVADYIRRKLIALDWAEAKAEADALLRLHVDGQPLLAVLAEDQETPQSDSCYRCQGDGALYADGKAHYPSEHAPTVACPVCGGSGRTPISDLALSEAGFRRVVQPPKEG
jgi:hypothetical protein